MFKIFEFLNFSITIFFYFLNSSNQVLYSPNLLLPFRWESPSCAMVDPDFPCKNCVTMTFPTGWLQKNSRIRAQIAARNLAFCTDATTDLFFFPFTNNTDFFLRVLRAKLNWARAVQDERVFFVVVFLVVFNGELLPGFVAYDDCGGSKWGGKFSASFWSAFLRLPRKIERGKMRGKTVSHCLVRAFETESWGRLGRWEIRLRDFAKAFKFSGIFVQWMLYTIFLLPSCGVTLLSGLKLRKFSEKKTMRP